MRAPSRSIAMTCCVAASAALLGGALFFACEKARTGPGKAGTDLETSTLAATANHPSEKPTLTPSARSGVAHPTLRPTASPAVPTTAPIAISLAKSPAAHPAVQSRKDALTPASPADSRRALNTLASLPLSFEQNDGQTDRRVKFLSRGAGYTLFLAQEETVLALRQRAQSAGCGGARGDMARRNSPKLSASCAEKSGAGAQMARQSNELESALSMKLVGANHNAAIAGIEELPGRSNYLIGNDPKKWHTNVPTFAKVQYQGIYPGVDLVYYGNQHALEYDFVVAPGADAQVIQLDVRGADKMHLDAAGDLVLPTTVGDVFLKKPEIYQQVGEEKKEIAGNYAIHDGHLVTIELGPYDRAQQLVIDPTILVSTFLGGSTTFGDFGHNVALDLQQAIYIAGQTGSTDFPTTPGSFQPRSDGLATTQPFITKIKADGSALVYSTFVTGTDNFGSRDFASGLGVDSSGSAWISGATNASDFPLVNPFQTTIGGAQSAGPNNTNHGCAFITKLTPDGSGLLFSSYFCGRDAGDNTQAIALALDPSGNPTIAGFTTSLHLPLVNPLQATLNGTQNAFVAKFTNAGAIVYSTYLGGNAIDQANSVAVDANGNAYITGSTTSTNFPTKNPFQAALAPGISMFTATQNAFISEIQSDGSALLYSTYLGGDNDNSDGRNGESGFGIAVVKPGTVAVVGQTNSSNFPTVSPIQGTYGGGNLDGWVALINTTATPPTPPVSFSTFVGGSAEDFLLGVAVDTLGNVYFSGGTSSKDLTFVNPLQGVLGGNLDLLLGQMKSDGSAYDFLTRVGLSFQTNGDGIAVDNATPPNIIVTGTTNSPSFPTMNPIQPQLLTGFDSKGNGEQATTAFVAKFSSAPGTGVTFFPPNGNFGSVNVSASSGPGPGTITNNSAVPITITSYQFSGPDALDFSTSAPPPATTNTCGTPLPVQLAAGQQCVQHFAFMPRAQGTRTATLTVNYTSGGTPLTITVQLTGQGVLPAVSVNPTTLDFGSIPLGGFQGFAFSGVTVTNEGGGPLAVGNAHVIGPDASSFSVSPVLCERVPPLQSCGISVGFIPLAVRAYSATLEIDDDAPGSPQMVPITGTGVSQITLTPSVDFGTVAVGNTTGANGFVFLSNGTASQLTLSSVVISGPNASDFSLFVPQFIGLEQCQAATVVPALGASCEANLVFKPSGTGLRTATLTITDNGAGSPRTVALSGMGANNVQAIPNPVNFGDVILGNQGPASVGLINFAATPVTATNFAITGPNAGDFSVNGSSACQAPANGGTCAVQLSFIPTVNGSETATLTISYTGAAGSPVAVNLQGVGIPPFGRFFLGVELVNDFFSSSLDFGGELLNEPSDPPMLLNLLNDNPTSLTIGAVTIAGTNPSDFAIVPANEDCKAGQVLASGAACAIHVTFTASAMGSRAANISVSYTGPSGSPVSATLAGMGVPPAITVSDTILDFGQRAIGSTAPNQAVFLLNGNTPFITLGTPAVTLTPVTPATGSPFSIVTTGLPTTTCLSGISQAGSGGSCGVVVNYSPTAVGTQTATLTIFDSDPGSPRTVTVTGTGIDPTPFASLQPTSLTFNTQTTGTTSAPQTATLTAASGTITLAANNAITIAGPNAADFAISAGGTTCANGQTLAAPSSCNVSVTFSPSALGTRTATLSVVDNSTFEPVQSLALSGTGVTAAITATPSPLNFGTVLFVAVPQPPPQPITLVNGGGIAITFTSAPITGTNAADFVVDPSSTCIVNPTVAANGESCTIIPDFKPTVNGPETATLTVNATQAGSPILPIPVTLNATGLSQITLNPTALAFGNVSVGTASPPTLGLTVTNNTANSVTFPNNSDSITGPNAADFKFTADTCSTPAGTPPMVLANSGICSVNVMFTPGGSGTRTATLNLGTGGTSPLPMAVPLSGTGTAPVVSLNPTSLSFGNQQVQTTSTALPITITNAGTDTLNLTKYAFTGTANQDYAVDTTSTCVFPNGSLAPGANCVLSIDFTPAALGSRPASITISDNNNGASNSTQTIPLSGTGTASGTPTASLNPTSLTFASQNVGTTSGSQAITVTNTGGANLVLGTTPTGLSGANPGDFLVTSNTSCTAGLLIAPNGTCVVSISFTPTAAGTRTATLTITDNSGGTAGATQTAPLTGTGASGAPPTAQLNPTSLTFAAQTVNTTSPAQTVTLTNAGGANLVLAATPFAFGSVAAGDYAAATGTTCTASLSIAPGGTCIVNVTFTPAAAGSRPATLTFTDNSGGTPGSTQQVVLNGTGTAAVNPAASLNPTSLTFAGQALGTTSTAQTVTLTNMGGANLVLGATPTVLGGTDPGDYAVVFGTTCTANLSIPPNGTCIVDVTFKPTATGSRPATLTITDNSGGVAGSTQQVALSGTGNAAANPTASLNPTSLTFAAQLLGTQSPAQTVTLTNTGGANLVIGAVPSVTGSPTFSTTSNTCTAGLSIPPNGTCTTSVVFKPTAAGPVSGSLSFTDNSGGVAGATQSVPLTGTGNSGAVASLSPTSLTFAAQSVGTTSAAVSVTVTSSGQTDLVLGANPLSLSGANAGDFQIAAGTTCTANLDLPVDNSCLIKITFTPGAAGSRTATLAITDNSGGSAGATQTVPLSGTGTAGTATATLTPPTVTFTSQRVNTTSGAQTFTVTSSGTGALVLAATNALQFGGANASDFAIAAGTTCANGSTVPANGGTCIINVTFKPGASGARTATITVNDNATPGTQTSTLNGTGIAPAVILKPTSLTFPGQNVGSSGTPQVATLNNSGTDTLNLAATNALVISGPNAADFALTGNTSCVSGLAITAGGSCNIAVAFTPGGVGTRTATLTITDDSGAVPGSTQTLPLSGTGLGALVTLNPTNVNFPPTILNTTSAPVNVTLTNTGNAPLTIDTNVTISGTNAGDFASVLPNVPGPACLGDSSVQPNASCNISFTFTPSANGARSATASITDTAGTQTIALTGATPNLVGLSTTVLNFGPQGLNSTSNPLTVTVTNQGTTPLIFKPGPTIQSETNEFALTTATTCSAATPVAPNGTCILSVTFTPSGLGQRGPANLVLTDNGGTQIITLNGTGADFSITGPTKPVVVNPGQLATFPITVTPGANGFPGPITFCAFAVAPATCFPNGVAAEFPQPTQTPNGNSVTTTLWVFTTGPGGASHGAAPVSYNRPTPPMSRWYALLGLFSVMTFLAWIAAQWRSQELTRFGILVPALAVMFAAIAFTGCGNGGGTTTAANNFTPAGTFQVLVQATSGTTMRSTIVTVQVQ
jgi:hypothetical protein